MRTNHVKRTLAAGGTSVGTMMFEFDSPGIGRIASLAGADFVIFDMEHSGWSDETVKGLIASTRAAETVPMVRVPSTQYHLLSRPLDAGAMGLMVPMVEDEAQARTIVRSAKYPPMGARGAGFSLAHDDFEGGDVAAKMTSANEEGFLIAQIETSRGIENVEEIAAVEGIDCLWIGHFDLTLSMGIPAQFGHPDFLKAVDRMLNACAKHGKAPGIMGGSVEASNAWLERGFRAIAYGGDLWIYQEALSHGIEEIKGVANQLRAPK